MGGPLLRDQQAKAACCHHHRALINPFEKTVPKIVVDLEEGFDHKSGDVAKLSHYDHSVNRAGGQVCKT